MSAPQPQRQNPAGTQLSKNDIADPPRCRLPPQGPLETVHVVTKAEAEREKNAQRAVQPSGTVQELIDPDGPQFHQPPAGLHCALPPFPPGEAGGVSAWTIEESQKPTKAKTAQGAPSTGTAPHPRGSLSSCEQSDAAILSGWTIEESQKSQKSKQPKRFSS